MAELYHKKGKTVIVAGRRKERLEEITKAAGERMYSAGSIDVTDTTALEIWAKDVVSFIVICLLLLCLVISVIFHLFSC